MPKTKPKPRTKPAEQRREELMNAAQKLFLKQGVAATTIDQITAGAGVAKGTFYLHFASKEDVVAALRKRFVLDRLARIEAAVAGHARWKAKLAAWAEASVDGHLDAQALHDIVFYESGPPHGEDHGGDVVQRHLASLLDGGTRAGAWSVDDCTTTAVFLVEGLHAIVHAGAPREKRGNRAKLVKNAEELFFRVAGLTRNA